MCPRGATRGASSPWLRSYMRAAGSTMQWPRLRAFGRVSSASGQATRGFVVELLVWASRLEQQRVAAEQWASST
jgi:hypothetical protein